MIAGTATPKNMTRQPAMPKTPSAWINHEANGAPMTIGERACDGCQIAH